jgi:hypothetical protein
LQQIRFRAAAIAVGASRNPRYAVLLLIRIFSSALFSNIFAVGAPRDRVLANTMSKGIVSAHRTKFVQTCKVDMI